MGNKHYNKIRELLDQAWEIANDVQSNYEENDNRNSFYQQLDELLVAINFASDRLDNALEAFYF